MYFYDVVNILSPLPPVMYGKYECNYVSKQLNLTLKPGAPILGLTILYNHIVDNSDSFFLSFKRDKFKGTLSNTYFENFTRKSRMNTLNAC